MATLTPQESVLSTSGLNLTANAAASGGDQFLNDGQIVLELTNAHASAARTITVNSQTACDQGSDHDIACVVAALTTRYLGPFNEKRFNDSNGYVQLTYSDSGADITVGVLKVKRK